MTLLARLGAALIAPRRLLRDLPPGTGDRDGLVLLGLYTLAVAVPALGQAFAEFTAIGGYTSLVRGALPLFPWLICSVLLDWVLGPARAHRTAVCMVPMLLIVSVAQLLNIAGPPLLGPADASMLLGAAAALTLAIVARNDITPLPTSAPAKPPATPDLSSGTAATPDRSSASASTPPATSDLSSGTASTPPATPDLSSAPAVTPDLSSGSASTPPAAPDLSSAPAESDLSSGTRLPALVGLALLALVAAAALRDAVQLARSWSTLAPLAPGEPLPAIAVPLLDGGTLSLAALPPRPHLLVFWTTWCGVCRTEMPMLRALHARYGERGLQVLLVNADDSPDQAALAAVYRDNLLLEELPVALDTGPLRRALRVRMFPHFVLVDAAGKPVLTHQGAIGERTLASAIEPLLKP